MSFMYLTCPWCQTEYTFGIVGRTPVGSGHKCKANTECQQPGCSRRGIFQVTCQELPHAAYDQFKFVCSDHIGEGVIMSSQPGIY